MNFNRSWPNQDDYFMEPNDVSWDAKEIADILSSKSHFFSDDSDDSNKKSKRLDARDYIIHHYNEGKLEPIFVADKNGNDSILHIFVPEGDDHVTYTNKSKSMKFINKFSGVVQESNKTTHLPNSLPLITMLHYSILPPKIINHFATSYLSLIRNESK